MKLTKKSIHSLSNQAFEGNPFISIYIPTYRAGHVQEDKLRFKNALSQAADHLLAKGNLYGRTFEKADAKKYLKPAFELLNNDDFWLRLSDGLVLFMNDQIFEYFIVPIRFRSMLYVGKKFYLSKLIPMLTERDDFYLLALSQGEVRFFEADRYHITPIEIADLVPENITAGLNKQYEKSLQFHTVGGGNGHFHGQGLGNDSHQTDLKAYFRMIDKGLMKMIRNDQVPMVLATVDRLASTYREISSYPHIVDTHVRGNPENEGPVMLHEKAMMVIGPMFDRVRAQEYQRYQASLVSNKASASFQEIAWKAEYGHVETLFLDLDASPRWGKVDSTTNQLRFDAHQEADNTCLLDETVMKTWSSGGNIHHLPNLRPSEITPSIKAIYRF
ncbi:MAG: hypothetical protein AAFP89_12795 [Bacteroidota bacterium]